MTLTAWDKGFGGKSPETTKYLYKLEEIGIIAATEIKFVIITWSVESAIEAIKKLADEQKLDDHYLENINESLSRLRKFADG